MMTIEQAMQFLDTAAAEARQRQRTATNDDQELAAGIVADTLESIAKTVREFPKIAATPPSPVPVREVTEAQADVLGVPKEVIEKVLAHYAVPPIWKVSPGEVPAAIADGPGSIITIEPYVPPSPVPDGWVMVPEEPTAAMMDAGRYQSSSDTSWADLHSAWKDMLAAAPAAPNGWQPIETAPKDGTEIILSWRSCEPAIGRYAHPNDMHERFYEFCNEGWICEGDAVIPRNQVDCTHWMPLPAAPTEARDG